MLTFPQQIQPAVLADPVIAKAGQRRHILMRRLLEGIGSRAIYRVPKGWDYRFSHPAEHAVVFILTLFWIEVNLFCGQGGPLFRGYPVQGDVGRYDAVQILLSQQIFQ